MSFYVVQFLELPYEGINNYVCVPHTWVIVGKVQDEKAVIAYPADEDPSLTRDRVKRKERCNDEWRYYMAYVKYRSTNYKIAEHWITKYESGAIRINTNNLLAIESGRIPGTQRESTLNTNSGSVAQGHSSTFYNPRKRLLTEPIKRPALPEPAQQSNGKQLKLNRPAPSSSTSVTASKPASESKKEQPTSIQENQHTKLIQTQVAAAVSNSTQTQRTQTARKATKVKKEELSSILSNLVKSVKRTLSATNKHIQSQQQLQAEPNEQSTEYNNGGLISSLKNITGSVTSNKDNVTDNKGQKCESEVEPLSSYSTSDSDVVTDEEISDNKLSTDRAPIERINDNTSTGISVASGSAHMPTAAQNVRSHTRSILEQQMLDHFASLFTQMGSTLRYTCDMYNTLRSSILETVQIYKKLLGAVEQFNSAQQNSASNESFSINLTPEVRQSPDERHTEMSASNISCIQDQNSNDDANTPLEINHNSWRFVLPAEYDRNDTKWTLKYKKNLPGLVELVPQSGVYVSYADLKYCLEVSKDCKSLARRLLTIVFTRNALSICLSITERTQVSNNIGSNARPELDDHACAMLLNFVLKHGFQRGWNTDLNPILSMIHSKIREVRFRYGVMVQC
ncbi:uncharacterized protein LOC119832895 [Zerene cesonia]|uniref:uncharacterized protein LOC119832895 n=1 Tax=Zerene cesonia TaxID=33412 RepID=UPI0018E56312|nr:uncharacterized protein LOC119832895 [Zerene cesonia]